MKTRRILPAALIVALCGATAVFADTFSTSFEGNAIGPVSPSTPGIEWWQAPNGVTTGAFTAAPDAAHTGNQALEVGYTDANAQGSITQLWSPALTQPAGEAFANKQVYSSLWVRTVAEENPLTSGQDFWFANSIYGDNRETYFGLYATPGSDLTAYSYDRTFSPQTIATGLEWGAWYRMEAILEFVPGLGDGFGNDLLTYNLYNAANTLIGTSGVVFGLEQYGATYADRLNLTMTYGGGVHPTGPMVWVDDVIIQTVPEPSSMALASLGLIGLVRGVRRARRRAEL